MEEEKEELPFIREIRTVASFQIPIFFFDIYEFIVDAPTFHNIEGEDPTRTLESMEEEEEESCL